LNGFANAHLTDILKVKATGKGTQPLLRDAELMAAHRSYLLREVRILRPRLVVGMGERAYEILTQWLKDDPPVCRMPHYSPRIANTENFKKVSQAIANLAASLREVRRD